MSALTSKQRSGVADTTIRSVACSATIGPPPRIGLPWPARASAFHVGQRRGQPRGEFVIVEGCLGPASGRRPHRRRAGCRSPSRRPMARATAPASVGRRTTRPVSPSATASPAPPEAPATWGTPAAAASRKTMPNPSCSRPSHRFRHSMAKTSAAPTSGGGRSSDTPPSRRTGAPYSAIRPASRSASRPRPAMATVRSGTSDRRRTAASMSTSIPLRGTSRLTLTTSGPSAGSPRSARAGARSSRRQGSEPVEVDPGGDLHHRRHPPPRRTAAAGLGGRVAAGRHDQRRCGAARGPAARPADREPAGDGHLGAVEQDGVGDARGGGRPDREGRPGRGPPGRRRPAAAASRIRRTRAGRRAPAPGPGPARCGSPGRPGRRRRRRRPGGRWP